MILDQTPWLLGTEVNPWYGLGYISWEFSYGNAEAPEAFAGSGKQFIGEIQSLGISDIFDASMGIT